MSLITEVRVECIILVYGNPMNFFIPRFSLFHENEPQCPKKPKKKTHQSNLIITTRHYVKEFTNLLG